jgi:Carboxypeptidase regulatory-like domain
MSGESIARAGRFALLVFTLSCLLLAKALGQGETTSAIVGEVKDATNAVVPGATVTITNHETGLKRSAQTDDAGRFNFPQLKPGPYSVKVEAQGFEPLQNDNVVLDWARSKWWISHSRWPDQMRQLR